MIRAFRLLLAAACGVAAFAGVTAHAQGAATVTFNDPNCASWAMSGTAPTFTLTCQALTCSISASPSTSPGLGVNVTLTASCPGASTYTWTGITQGCPGISGIANVGNMTGPASQTLGCVYRVDGDGGALGKGLATTTISWSSGPPPPPTGCSASISTSPSPLTNAGGTATVSVSGCTGTAGLSYSWSRNGQSGWSTSSAPPADTLAAGGTAGYTNTYQVNVCNGSTCINVPSSPLTANVPGTGGGGGVDMSACTAKGYTGRLIDIIYSLTSNQRVFTSTLGYTFGNSDALVIRFTTPAADTTGGANLTTTEAAGYPTTRRLGTLSTLPCQFGGGYSGQIPASNIGTGLAFAMNINTPTSGCGFSGCKISLLPNTTYYWTIVNSETYGPNLTPNCTASSCHMIIDAN